MKFHPEIHRLNSNLSKTHWMRPSQFAYLHNQAESHKHSAKSIPPTQLLWSKDAAVNSLCTFVICAQCIKPPPIHERYWESLILFLSENEERNTDGKLTREI